MVVGVLPSSRIRPSLGMGRGPGLGLGLGLTGERILANLRHMRKTGVFYFIEFPLAGGHRRPWFWAFGCRRLCLVRFLASFERS